MPRLVGRSTAYYPTRRRAPNGFTRKPTYRAKTQYARRIKRQVNVRSKTRRRYTRG